MTKYTHNYKAGHINREILSTVRHKLISFLPLKERK